jgi:hypothetical protein
LEIIAELAIFVKNIDDLLNLATWGPVKGLDHSNLPSLLELVCDVPSLVHAHPQTEFSLENANTSSPVPWLRSLHRRLRSLPFTLVSAWTRLVEK